MCTITVNSSDEKDIFRQNLPRDEFQFVELVESGRPDWLSRPAARVSTAMFFSFPAILTAARSSIPDRLDAREYLPVGEMERVSCSDSCPGLFSQLKEVYLFGCNTLNAEAMRAHPPRSREVWFVPGTLGRTRSACRGVLNERHGES